MMANANNNDRQKEISKFYNLRGYFGFNTGNCEGAREDMIKACVIDPSNTYAHENLAETYVKLGDRDMAVQSFRNSLQINPDNQNVKMRLAGLLIDMRRFDEAYEVDTLDVQFVSMILNAIFKFSGKCIMCGKCCKDMVLTSNHKPIKTMEEYEEVCKNDPPFKKWIPKMNQNNTLVFSCSKLDKKGKCSDYESRQSLCRVYPNYKTTSLKSGCGFIKMTVGLQPGEVKNLELINKLGVHGKKFGLNEEMLLLFKAIEFDLGNTTSFEPLNALVCADRFEANVTL